MIEPMIEIGKAYIHKERENLVYPCSVAKFVSNNKDKDIVVYYSKNKNNIRYFARDVKDFCKRYKPICQKGE